MEPRICPYCQQPFTPSRFRPSQQICSAKPCQDRRKAESHRVRKVADPVYAEVCRDAQRQWREANPDYQRQYRATHPDAAERNRQQQRLRDERRRIGDLVKNNLAFDLTSSVSNIFLVGPAAAQLDKNNLAQSKLLIFHNLQSAASPSLRS
jgi:hypothetical protein